MRMSNQEAIGVLESINAKTDYFLINDDARAEAIDMAISALQAQDLQPTCNQLATDCVSRQAAIDAVSKGCQEWRGIFGRCEENLLALPSAHPEIIRCEDCKYRDADDFCTRRGYPNVLVSNDGFCDKGERSEE